MKFLYVTDLHGDKDKYRKILEVAVNKGINVIINGGDMLLKQCNRHEEQPLFIKGFLNDYFKELKEHQIRYLCMFGNDDLQALDELFDSVCENYDNVYNIAGKKVIIDDYEFIGMNYILDHPFGCKDRVITEMGYIPQRQLSPIAGISNMYGYDKIYDWLEYSTTQLPHMYDVLNNLPVSTKPRETIYIKHMPPASLHLGQLQYQDLDIGSVDIYYFLKEKQPLLSLHGHIHECPDTQKGKWINGINNTICIQPGQTELHDMLMTYVEIDLLNEKYERNVILIKELDE